MLDTSIKARHISESVIREMTRLCRMHDAINLAQGYPDFPAPEALKDAARRAIAADLNQYSITWGSASLRAAIAAKIDHHYGWTIDPAREITVTCGSTEAMMASILGVLDPGDELVVFEPFYENYLPDAVLAGVAPRFVPLRPPAWRFDPDVLAAAFTERTRGIVLNNPNNPTGRVFRREELEAIADLCRKWDVVAFSDEVYEHIVYDGAGHVPIATLPGMGDRTVTINALSKTYSVTGWRVGWAIASPTLTAAIRRVHDFLTVAAPTPLQEAGVAAMAMPDVYYRELAEGYRARRDVMVEGLRDVGFECSTPEGAYYVLADATGLGVTDDVAFARRLVEEIRVGCVPGSSFYSDPDRGRSIIRFAFAKREETLREAIRRLEEGLAN